MTLTAVGGEVSRHVIWICSLLIILEVTIVAFYPKRLKTKQGGRRMTGITIGGDMGANQRKTAQLMYTGNIVYDPGIRRMTPSAFKTHSLLVNIGMTGHAFFPGL